MKNVSDKHYGRRASISRAGVTVSVSVVAMFLSQAALSACVANPPPPVDPTDVRSLPLINLNHMTYIGGFTLPADTFGNSSLNFSSGNIEIFGNSLFIVGHVYEDAIAEFQVPDLVNSTDIRSLNSSGAPVQNFSSVLNRAVGGNGQSIDQINGLEVFDGQLIVNGIEYYDGPGDNTSTTLVVSDGGNISGSIVKGYHRLPDGAKAAGWISELPPKWQAELGRTHLTGSSSGDPIISRHSVGPSAYTVNARDIVDAPSSGGSISTTKLLEFDLINPLNDDLFNNSRQNDLWTHTSKALFGMVVPGTRTYATFGIMTGGEFGVGYKITQDDGTLCGGYCSIKASDEYNYYWFWDMNDLLDVKAGVKASHAVRPYAYGKFNVPFQTGGKLKPIGGGSFDSSNNTLYFSVNKANNTVGQFENPPVIAAYTFSGF